MHEHNWKPISEFRQYICDCGATGVRKSVNSPIIAHKEPKTERPPMTYVGGSSRKGKRGPGGW